MDAHRPGSVCLDPQRVGLELRWKPGRGGATIPSKANGSAVWGRRRGHQPSWPKIAQSLTGSPKAPERIDVAGRSENSPAGQLGAGNEHPRITQTREMLAPLLAHPDATVRTAVRLAVGELDRARTEPDPEWHIAHAIEALDAALNPTDD